ncbi:MAG: hypothetical protein KKF62_07980 [Bacteroidetes bacterium]|nr:hypothetical protein [Bacteroidota bacterium]MBU1117206.1 hypothetical protein [Bacteroidota bacterium]MBU1798489.1 hypothetical protein [Bacteroidota bacterium]
MEDELNEFQEYLDRIMFEQNNMGAPDLEGYSPYEMHQIIYAPFGESSPLKLIDMQNSEYELIPIFNQIKYLLSYIDSVGDLKLTQKGFLPTKVVENIFKQKFVDEIAFCSSASKIYREADYLSINLTRILLEISGLTKKRYNKLSLTKVGKKVLANNQQLFQLIFEAFTMKFNWAYYDGYQDEQIGKTGFGFSLILLSKYGNKERLNNFYSQKYFQAFPIFEENLEYDDYRLDEKDLHRCYSVRTFDRFLIFFGLIKIRKGKDWLSDDYITKTELFDKLIKCVPPSSIGRAGIFN